MVKNHFKFKSIGENVAIYDPVTIIQPEAIVLGSNVIISEFSFLVGGQGLYLGNFIHISTHSSISGGGYCILQDFVGLSAGVRLITGSENVDGSGLTNPTIPPEYRSFYRSFVNCEKHSFLSTNVVVHPGVTIGEGAVVGSGSIVNKDLELWGVYVGTPARRIKERPKQKILEMENELLEITSVAPSDFTDVIRNIMKEVSSDK